MDSMHCLLIIYLLHTYCLLKSCLLPTNLAGISFTIVFWSYVSISVISVDVLFVQCYVCIISLIVSSIYLPYSIFGVYYLVFSMLCQHLAFSIQYLEVNGLAFITQYILSRIYYLLFGFQCAAQSVQNSAFST